MFLTFVVDGVFPQAAGRYECKLFADVPFLQEKLPFLHPFGDEESAAHPEFFAGKPDPFVNMLS